ncbi:hypothetical protein D477_020893 [Arthrobacter crystallopoietes BAB-32]|uniref:AAA domain-containing protein n=1 Tax=Arthrobacter crystallopoietes BAB-32 TaxID=1246476 RepID=N1UTD6_9MICC|nr:AAA family ATPase [Arthrobacter crystallopoietes]EMY32295.1 hypothetical protein D477_020893 [Arthrobacter crystallopoietes BAB-32]
MPAGARFLRQLAGLFRSDDYSQRLIAAAAGAQDPVATGRRIAVISSRGGAGKTTTTAALALVFAAMRQDAVAAVDNDPGLGSLPLRLGLDTAPALDAVASAVVDKAPATRDELAAQLAAAEANLFATGARLWHPRADYPALDRALTSISRYFPITLLDCPTGISHPDSVWAVKAAHAVVLVVPATVAGTQDALSYQQAWQQDPATRQLPLLAVVTATDADAPLDPVHEAVRLSRDGLDAMTLPYDRHLASGVEIDLALLAPQTRLDATALASRVLQAANGNR